ncbi:erythropoietin receptor isoform X2 [Ahaetulla prasina]|uniref:erythropoietin receptor isoform X2 n=1 Tax=Ahaetulla prasina TaxID=499056 RepID=UPI00264954A7|nr:erythropoietin receptor isoform X2 [Ahaetulla prasina]
MEQAWRSTAAFLILVFWASGSLQEGPGNLGAHFNSKVARLLTEELLNPKCFTQQLEDLACFWEISDLLKEPKNQSIYSFYYKFEEDNFLKSCNLTVENTSRNTTLYTCFFQRQDISAFSPLEIKVFEGLSSNNTLYTRTIYVERLVFLDPPSNLTVQFMESSGQLNVSWQSPPFAYMENNIRYEVTVSPEGYRPQRFLSSSPQVESTSGQTYYLLNLKGGTHYTLAVRAKPNGVSYDGYWSEWSQEVSMTIPNDLDPLILILSAILIVIILLLAFITLMSNRRFLKKKIWPVIPSPEHEFKDLFTIYKGNFQLWLGHQSTYPWWSQNTHYLEEQPFLVELLSECDSHKVDNPPLPPPLPPKRCSLVELPYAPELSLDDYLVLDKNVMPCCLGGNGSPFLLGRHSSEDSDLVLAEEERITEPSQASSSFEYTVFDPSSKSLSPQGHQAELQFKSNYQMVSDSGISADYSLVDSTAGPTSLYTNLCDRAPPPPPPPFLPTYIECS